MLIIECSLNESLYNKTKHDLFMDVDRSAIQKDKTTAVQNDCEVTLKGIVKDLINQQIQQYKSTPSNDEVLLYCCKKDADYLV